MDFHRGFISNGASSRPKYVAIFNPETWVFLPDWEGGTGRVVQKNNNGVLRPVGRRCHSMIAVRDDLVRSL
ncbi:MAG: hypothetical protein NTV34_12385, partial [Proteobacteria bacterium]|nr:hypothetical protein [Pseudomonadota bacterium]